MATATKRKSRIYHLQNDKQFWEISVDGNETTIRSGKINFKGRTFPRKQHANTTKAMQFAVRHVNTKIMLGFENHEDGRHQTPNKPPIKKASSQMKPWRGPPKKRESARTFARQSTMIITTPSCSTLDSSHIHSPTSTEKPKWRKPPKKQTTVRRIAKQESLRRKAVLARMQKASTSSNQKEKPNSLSKQKSNIKRQAATKQNTVILSSDSEPSTLMERRTTVHYPSSSSSTSCASTLTEEPPLLRRRTSAGAIVPHESFSQPPVLRKRSSLRRQLF